MDKYWVWGQLLGSLVTPFFFAVVFCVSKFFNFYADADEKIYYGEGLSIVPGRNRKVVPLFPFLQDCISEKGRKRQIRF